MIEFPARKSPVPAIVTTVELRNGRPEAIRSSTRRYMFVGPAVTNVDPTDYAGLYWSDELGTEWRVEPDTANAADIALLHRTPDTDRFRPAFRDGFWSGGDWITFARDAHNRVTGFRWSNGRAHKLVFSRH